MTINQLTRMLAAEQRKKQLTSEEKDIENVLNKVFCDSTVVKDVQKTTFSPSKLVYGHGGCPRFWWFMFSGVEVTEHYQFESLRAMASGTATHEHLQSFMEESGLDMVIEDELFNTDPPIHAFADAVVTTSEGKRIPIEIKTTRDESYRWRVEHQKGAAYNELQLLCYMKITNSDTGFLLYENRNSFERIMLPVFMDQENTKRVNDAFDWMSETYKLWEHDTMPMYFPGRRQNSKICASCPVKETCDSAGEGVTEFSLLGKYNG